VDFLSLNMADLVTQPAIREYLRDAAGRANRNDYEGAVGMLTHAFDELVDDYAERKKIAHNRSVFGFGERIKTGVFAPVRKIADAVGRDFAQHYEHLTDAAAEMQRSLRVVALGLDYRHYARMAMITPMKVRHPTGELQWYYMEGLLPVTNEDYEFCRNFVIT